MYAVLSDAVKCIIGSNVIDYLFLEKDITGLDLSPHFLSVAVLRERERKQNIKYVMAKAEDTKLESASIDIATLTFLVRNPYPQLAK